MSKKYRKKKRITASKDMVRKSVARVCGLFIFLCSEKQKNYLFKPSGGINYMLLLKLTRNRAYD